MGPEAKECKGCGEIAGHSWQTWCFLVLTGCIGEKDAEERDQSGELTGMQEKENERDRSYLRNKEK